MPDTDRPPAREEQRLFEIFEVLREHVVEVSADFRRGVAKRLDGVHREDEAHRLGDVLTSMLVEAFNILGGPQEAAREAEGPDGERDDEHD